MKEITRREMLRECFSKDTLKNVFMAYYDVKKELNDQNKLTGDEAVLKIAQRLKKKRNLFPKL